MEKYCCHGKIECKYYFNGLCRDNGPCFAVTYDRDNAVFGHMAEIIAMQKGIMKRLDAWENKKSK